MHTFDPYTFSPCFTHDIQINAITERN